MPQNRSLTCPKRQENPRTIRTPTRGYRSDEPSNGDDVSIQYEVALALRVHHSDLGIPKSPGWFPEGFDATPAFRIISRRITDLKTGPRLLIVGPNLQDHVLTEVSQEKNLEVVARGLCVPIGWLAASVSGPLSVTLSGRSLAKLSANGIPDEGQRGDFIPVDFHQTGLCHATQNPCCGLEACARGRLSPHDLPARTTVADLLIEAIIFILN